MAHFKNYLQSLFVLTLARHLSLLTSSNNSQSQSILISTKENVDDGVDSDTKDCLAFVVDGHKTKKTKMQHFWKSLFVLFIYLFIIISKNIYRLCFET